MLVAIEMDPVDPAGRRDAAGLEEMAAESPANLLIGGGQSRAPLRGSGETGRNRSGSRCRVWE
jgi:hypothetical protein